MHWCISLHSLQNLSLLKQWACCPDVKCEVHFFYIDNLEAALLEKKNLAKLLLLRFVILSCCET